jgi:hypothetical protein
LTISNQGKLDPKVGLQTPKGPGAKPWQEVCADARLASAAVRIIAAIGP